MNKNVWTVDIETSPCVVMVWGMGKQYISHDQLIKDWHIMSFSAKKLNEPVSSLVYMETRNADDSALLKKIWDIFDEADIIITQNGKKFDEPRIKARMMLMGLKPYRSFKHYDTFLQNTDKEFTSHSLAYLTEKFCVKFKKLKHKLFPGLSLWKECLGIKINYNPNPKAWKEMKAYNNNDVLSTEELYLNTRGWAKSSAPTVYEAPNKCATCDSSNVERRGFDVLKKGKYQKLHCKECGRWFRGDKIEVKK